MKLMVIDNKPFIRTGGKTLAPVEAIAHFENQVAEPQLAECRALLADAAAARAVAELNADIERILARFEPA